MASADEPTYPPKGTGDDAAPSPNEPDAPNAHADQDTAAEGAPGQAGGENASARPRASDKETGAANKADATGSTESSAPDSPNTADTSGAPAKPSKQITHRSDDSYIRFKGTDNAATGGLTERTRKRRGLLRGGSLDSVKHPSKITSADDSEARRGDEGEVVPVSHPAQHPDAAVTSYEGDKSPSTGDAAEGYDVAPVEDADWTAKSEPDAARTSPSRQGSAARKPAPLEIEGESSDGTDKRHRRPRKHVRDPRSLPRNTTRGGAWGALLICLVMAAPAVLLHIDRPEVVDTAEADALLLSMQTWQRRGSASAPTGLGFDQFVPYRDGQRDLLGPPGMVWWHQVVFNLPSEVPIPVKPSTDGKTPPPSAGNRIGPAAPADLSADTNQAGQTDQGDQDAGAAGKAKADTPGESNREQPPATTLDTSPPLAPTSAMAMASLRRARYLSAALALLTVVAVFWAGHSLGGTLAATLGALVCIANPVFLFHGRNASPAMMHACFATLACATALWAIRPLRPQPSINRQFIGWLLCGLVCGVALLTHGLIVGGTIFAPILLLMVLCPNRISHLLGLVAAVLIALLLCLPWIILAHEHAPDASSAWFAQLAPIDPSPGALWQEGARRGWLLGLALLPWLPWLLGALVQPLSTSSSGIRLKLFLGLVWFIVVCFVLLTAPRTDTLGALLPALPIFAVAMGHLFHLYASRAAEGWYVRSFTLLRWVHLAGVLALSLLAPLFLSSQQYFIERGWLREAVLTNWSTMEAVGVGAALLLLAALIFRAAIKHRPARMLAFSAVWTLTAGGVVAMSIAYGPLSRQPAREPGQQLARLTSNAPLYVLRAGQTERFDPIMQFYAGRAVPAVAESQLTGLLEARDHIYLLAATSTQPPPIVPEPTKSDGHSGSTGDASDNNAAHDRGVANPNTVDNEKVSADHADANTDPGAGAKPPSPPAPKPAPIPAFAKRLNGDAQRVEQFNANGWTLWRLAKPAVARTSR